MPGPGTAPPRAAVTAVLLAALACLVCLIALPAQPAAAVSDVAQGVAALLAGVGAARHVHRCRDRRTRAAWVLIAAACLSWAAGEAYWCWYSLRTDEVPFPSVADVGFLGFSFLMALGLLVHPARRSRGLLQRLLDGLMTGAAVGLVSWLTVLGAVAGADGVTTHLERLLLLAYPSADVLLVVLTVLLLSRARRRAALSLVGAGVVALGVSDSSFAYLGAVGLYDGGLIDMGWIGGFLLIALAATCPEPLPDADGHDPDAGDGITLSASPLPYVPVLVALGVVIALTLAGRSLTQVEMLTACAIVLCLLARQYLSVQDNVALTRTLTAQQGELRRQAFSDPLTGVGNRALFLDRLEHALELRTRDGRRVAVLFLDLDDFKLVNDSFGHAVGDALLVEVAGRLVAATRAGDTVARLGGDEFAVLMEDAVDPEAAAARLRAALAPAFALAGAEHRVGVSLGLASVGPGDPQIGADDLLARSDAAMYAAKRSAVPSA